MTTPSPSARTSAQWWNETKRDPDALVVWLRKQYQGKATAAAETMRLERISAIASDVEAPEDIRLVFARILRDERFHARAFARLASNLDTDD